MKNITLTKIFVFFTGVVVVTILSRLLMIEYFTRTVEGQFTNVISSIELQAARSIEVAQQYLCKRQPRAEICQEGTLAQWVKSNDPIRNAIVAPRSSTGSYEYRETDLLGFFEPTVKVGFRC